MSENLHPNIARIAARYDQILVELNQGLVTPEVARDLIYQLEARDDHGVRWTIDPATGNFLRRTAFGELIPDTPPSYGVDTKDGFHYSSSGASKDPAWHITNQVVPEPDGSSFTLDGSTAFKSPDAQDLDMSQGDIDAEIASAQKTMLLWGSLIVGILSLFGVLFFAL